MVASGRQIVDPPSFTPIPYGLLTTVEWVPSTDAHWQNGITYQPTCSSSVTGIGASTYDPCSAVTGIGAAVPPTGIASSGVVTQARGATAFNTYVEFDCSPVGNTPGQALATAEQALTMAEPWQVERAFWTGFANGGQNVVFPNLVGASQVLDGNGIILQLATATVTGGSYGGLAGDTYNIESAIGLLEGALANCYDGVGVIHVPQMLTPTLDAWNVIKANGPRMFTANGNKVAIGAGYPGSGPGNVARSGGKCWLYATGNVFGFRSSVNVRAQNAQAIDRGTNTIKMIADRTYVLGWDCCPAFAIQATIGVPGGT